MLKGSVTLDLRALAKGAFLKLKNDGDIPENMEMSDFSVDEIFTTITINYEKEKQD